MPTCSHAASIFAPSSSAEIFPARAKFRLQHPSACTTAATMAGERPPSPLRALAPAASHACSRSDINEKFRTIDANDSQNGERDDDNDNKTFLPRFLWTTPRPISTCSQGWCAVIQYRTPREGCAHPPVESFSKGSSAVVLTRDQPAGTASSLEQGSSHRLGHTVTIQTKCFAIGIAPAVQSR